MDFTIFNNSEFRHMLSELANYPRVANYTSTITRKEPSTANTFYTLENSKEGNELILKVLLPGYDKSEISVEYDDNSLFIKTEIDESKQVWPKKNSSYEISISENVNLDKAETSYSNGVLEVKMPIIGKQKLKLS